MTFPIIRHLGQQPYETTWQAMQTFTQQRTPETVDEFWYVQHPSVYTLGLNGKREHLLNTHHIPVVKTDRGGQVTYHGLGQVVIYTLLDVQRLKINTRQLVSALENAMIDVLAHYGISAYARADAPGVYTEHKKIGSIGLRIKQLGCYHGLSLNNQMDLTPFLGINPCGYTNLPITQISDYGIIVSCDELANRLFNALWNELNKEHY